MEDLVVFFNYEKNIIYWLNFFNRKIYNELLIFF